MISEGIKVKKFAQIRIILEAKFGNDALRVSNRQVLRRLYSEFFNTSLTKHWHLSANYK